MERVHPELFEMPPQDHPNAVVSYAEDRPAHDLGKFHSHPRGQLLHIVSGTLSVETGGDVFVVPSERAVWMPTGFEHRTLTRSPTAFRTIYIRPEAAPDLPDKPTVVHVTPLLRELILTLMSWRRDYDEAGPQGRLAAVLIDQIAASPVAPLHLPMPDRGRLRSIAGELRDNPADRRGLAAIAAAAALSPRTFERRFQAQTGMTLRAWRRQAKLLMALELLADGEPVGSVADQLGYDSSSAFIAVFRTAFGVSPGRYFSAAPN